MVPKMTVTTVEHMLYAVRFTAQIAPACLNSMDTIQCTLHILSSKMNCVSLQAIQLLPLLFAQSISVLSELMYDAPDVTFLGKFGYAFNEQTIISGQLRRVAT